MGALRTPLGNAFVGCKQGLFRVTGSQAVKQGTETELGDGVGSERAGDSAETQSDKVLPQLPEGEALGAEGAFASPEKWKGTP